MQSIATEAPFTARADLSAGVEFVFMKASFFGSQVSESVTLNS
jgi:hypothetical protein